MNLISSVLIIFFGAAIGILSARIDLAAEGAMAVSLVIVALALPGLAFMVAITMQEFRRTITGTQLNI